MNNIVKEQIVKSRDIVIRDVDGNKIDIDNLENYDMLLIEKFVDDRNSIESSEFYEIEFTSELVKPKQSGIRVVPLATMKCSILGKNQGRVYVDCSGINREFNKCQHCLKFGNYITLCEVCKSRFSVEIEKIKWEGWINLNQIKKIIKVEKWN